MVPQEETRRIQIAEAARRRPALIREMDEFGGTWPADDWIVAQRVGLRIKQGWAGEAESVARECRATPWWCKALLGFALHVQGRFPESDAAFGAALEGMPEDMRCSWSDELQHVLQGEVLEAWRELSCADRIELERRVWWLADPLHLQRGNDRRTEHFVRVLGMWYHHDAHVPEGDCRRSPHHAQALLGGWQPWWWTGIHTGLDLILEGQPFMGDGGRWSNPLETQASDWELPARRTGPRYRPIYGPVRSLPQQTAFFQRGDSVLVATAIEPPGRVTEAGVALSRDERAEPVTAAAPGSEAPVRVRVHVPRGRHLVSVEAYGSGAAFRERFGHGLPPAGEGGLRLSDLLVFEWEDGLEHDLDDVFPRMIGTRRLQPGMDLGLFWEAYGVPADAAFEVQVSVRPAEGGLLRRIGEALRVAGSRSAVSVAWQEPAAGQEAWIGRHIRLDLSSLEPGSYELVLDVTSEGSAAATTSRTIEITGD